MREIKKFEDIKPNNQQDIRGLYNNSIKELKKIENQLIYKYGDGISPRTMNSLNMILSRLEQMTSKYKYYHISIDENK